MNLQSVVLCYLSKYIISKVEMSVAWCSEDLNQRSSQGLNLNNFSVVGCGYSVIFLASSSENCVIVLDIPI